MVASSGSGSRRGGAYSGSGQVLKKGPWTAAEDAILMECVRRHGEGNWIAVRRNSGLLRCGKSCRLRWANHLRPNLKKGTFSPQEERLIIELHAKLGNKWSRMALLLPGRTDNEIKNYWNTRVKRLQRANLPIYPDDIHRQHGHPLPPPSSSQYSKLDPSLSLSLFDSINFPTITSPVQPNSTSSLLSHPKIPNYQFELFHDNESISNFPFQSSSSILAFSTETSSLFFQREMLSSASPFQSKSGEFDIIRSPAMEGSFNPFGLVPNAELTELPSIQSPVFPVNTPTSSGTTGGDADADARCVSSEAFSGGLLEDLLEESKALVNAENSAREISVAAGRVPGSGIGLTKDAGNGVHDSNSANSSVGDLGDFLC